MVVGVVRRLMSKMSWTIRRSPGQVRQARQRPSTSAPSPKMVVELPARPVPKVAVHSLHEAGLSLRVCWRRRHTDDRCCSQSYRLSCRILRGIDPCCGDEGGVERSLESRVIIINSSHFPEYVAELERLFRSRHCIFTIDRHQLCAHKLISWQAVLANRHLRGQC